MNLEDVRVKLKKKNPRMMFFLWWLAGVMEAQSLHRL